MTDDLIALIAMWRGIARGVSHGIYTRDEVARAINVCADELEATITREPNPPPPAEDTGGIVHEPWQLWRKSR